MGPHEAAPSERIAARLVERGVEADGVRTLDQHARVGVCARAADGVGGGGRLDASEAGADPERRDRVRRTPREVEADQEVAVVRRRDADAVDALLRADRGGGAPVDAHVRECERRAGIALVALLARDPLNALDSLDALDALLTLIALIALRAGRSLLSTLAVDACWPLRAGRPRRPGRTRVALVALGAARAHVVDRDGDAVALGQHALGQPALAVQNRDRI